MMSRRRFLWHLALVGLLLGGLHSTASAQYSGSAARNLFGATRNFLWNRPTVSPYVNLATRSGAYGLPNYHTLVRPQIEQREAEMARQRQTVNMQRDINAIQNQFRQSQVQAAGVLMTGRYGWSSRGLPRFGAYLNFYPGFQRIPR